MSVFIFLVAHLSFGNKGLFVLAVPAGVLAEVDVVWIAFLNALDQLEHANAMTPSVVRMKSSWLMFSFPERVMLRHDAIGERDRQNAFLRCRAFALPPVLIGAGDETRTTEFCQQRECVPVDHRSDRR